MRYLRLVLFAWAVTFLAATLGALVGGIWQGPGRFIGATIAATLGVLLTVRLLAKQGWLNSDRQRGATIGGLVGLALAAPLAQMQLSVVIPILALLMVGLVMILAAGRRAVQ